MNELRVILITGTIVFLYSQYLTIQTSKEISEILTKEIRKSYKLSIRIKALLLKESYWMDEINDRHKPLFKESKTYWKTYVKKHTIIISAYIVLILIVLLTEASV